jgi:eukaryotic-like serine/threonine-protein kinase
MGLLYRAIDRLTTRVVTLKRLRVTYAEGSFHASGPSGLALAREFRFLASLRHPNIVSVLDYGFDAQRQPYLVMDLEEGAETIVAAARDQPPALQVELLVQLLRALAYLHRHGVIHRDVKPDNVLVVHGQVKVLDFGLSVFDDAVEAERRQFAGTLAYMAPEVLRGEPITPRADLYAVGLITFEILAGQHPFAERDAARLYEEILHTILPRESDAVEPALRPVLRRLLAKDPAERFGAAGEVVLALAHALGQSLSEETVATRESFLQTAPFVDRVGEIAALRGLLAEAAAGRGAVRLVAGESGVGKSRLLDELRTHALVDRAIVARGQAMGDGGAAYHVWREVIRNLVLRVNLEDSTASILKTAVPDLPALLGREVLEAPRLDAEATQSRLALAIEQLVRLQPAPVVLLLEDLQWAGSESLGVLRWLARVAPTVALLVLGSYREDESPDLAASMNGVRQIQLRRLAVTDIARLGEAMIGPAGQRPDVVAFLERETEGIPFFVVEVVRSLAEGARGLTRIAELALPKQVVSGGMVRILRRRLERVPPESRTTLAAAAVIGRMIDAPLLRTFDPELALDSWIAQVAAAGVLELSHDEWLFGHDKLREQLLQDLPVTTRRDLHRRVAEAIESTYPGRSDRVASLAHHWRAAEVPERELPWAIQAGLIALESGACREAVSHLGRALELMPRVEVAASRHGRRRWIDPSAAVDLDGPGFRVGTVDGALAEAHFRLGDLGGCAEHGRQALLHFGQTTPSSAAGYILAILRQTILRGAQVALRVGSRDLESGQRVAAEVARVHLRLMEASFYRLELLPLVWSTLSVLNQCVPVGPSSALAQGYVVSGMIAFAMGARRYGNALCRHAMGIAETIEAPRDVAWVLGRWANLQKGGCQWEAAAMGLEQGAALAHEVGDLRLWEECVTQRGFVHFYAAEFERALERFREVHQHTLKSGNRQITCWALILQGDASLRLGRDAEAFELYAQALELYDAASMRSEGICIFGMKAVAHLRIGDVPGALDAARRALGYITASRPFAYWTQQGTAGTAEVFLTLLEDGAGLDAGERRRLMDEARAACRGTRAYGRAFPLGRPHALVWDGLRCWLAGRRRRAFRKWRAAAALAERLDMPYERGRALLEIGRHLPLGTPERARQLGAAADIFARIGSAAELARARGLVGV